MKNNKDDNVLLEKAKIQNNIYMLLFVVVLSVIICGIFILVFYKSITYILFNLS